MKIKLAFCVGVLCMAVFFCGCQNTQQPVVGEEERQQRETDEPQATGQGEEKEKGTAEEASGFGYCTVDELKAITLSELGGENLYFSGEVGVDFSGIEGVNVLHLSREHDFAKTSNLKRYTSLFGVDREKLVRRKNKSLGSWFEYQDDSEQNYMLIGEDGALVRMAGRLGNAPSNTVEEKYATGTDDVSGVKVTLADKKVDLGEFCERTENWLGKNMPVGGLPGMHYHISDVFVRKLKGEKGDRRVLSMCAEYEFQGIPLDSFTYPLARRAKDVGTNETAGSMFARLDYEDSGIPSMFSRNDFFSVKSLEPVDKVVDFKSAVRLVEENRAKFSSFRISKVLALYALHLEEGSKEGTEIEGRPVYAFLSGYDSDIDETEWGVVKDVECDHYIYVDMVTGDVSMG